MEGILERLAINPEPLASADARALIARLDAELTERYPNPEDNHFELSADQVGEDRGVFLIARLDAEPVGCGALRQLEPATGEIKRMYVAPSARGAGVGRRLLEELEWHARRLGLRRLVLETGERQPEALRLYERAGFFRIDCFGEYLATPASVCMAKILDQGRPRLPSG
jgi:putative acetyltransferase